MIYGIGTDIVEVSRVQEVLDRWGDRFIDRVFTEAEAAYCGQKARPASRFALRFAAKEAFAKALGTGFRGGLSFREIEVVRDQKGAPALRLHGKSLSASHECGLTRTHLSLSDDGDYAVAFVVLES